MSCLALAVGPEPVLANDRVMFHFLKTGDAETTACGLLFRTVACDCKLLVGAGLLATRIDLKLRVWRRVWLETVKTHRAATYRQAI